MSALVPGIGLYAPEEVARFTRLPIGKVRRWLSGYAWRDEHGAKRSAGPVVKHLLPEKEGRIALTFRDLIEIYWVKTFLDHGASMQAIRRAAAEAEALLLNDHPFCSMQFAHAGRDIFARVLDDQERERIIQLGKGQFVFSEVIKPLLQELEYAETDGQGVARWWPLGKDRQIVVDPRVAMGAPTTRDYGVPTDTLYQAWRSARDEAEVARWFEVPLLEVHDAIEFEESHQRAS
jgi:uncharacterized protein (DUF433 family)